MPGSATRASALDHVVVVLFEIRSLDNVLGRLYGPGTDGRPAAAAAPATAAQRRQGPGDRGEELPVVPPMPPGSAKARTSSLWTCWTISRFRSVAK